MSLEHVVLPSLAVVVTWLGVGALLAGCGYLTRRLLLRLLPASTPSGIRVGDVWVGLALLIAYLQVWSLVLRIGAGAWVAPLALGIAGAAVAVKQSERPRGAPVRPGVILVAGLGTLWIANRALGPASDYDFGLYHLNAAAYASHYAAIPGLANLQSRLGAGNAHLLLMAFLGRGPWGGAAPHLVTGMLVSWLFADVAARFALRPVEPRRPAFTRRMGLLLVPASIAVAGVNTGYRLSSPNLDMATFVLVVVGALYLAQSFEDGFVPASVLTSTAAFAVAAATRPLYWLPTIFAAGLLAYAATRGPVSGRRGLLGAVTLVGALPVLLALGWMARQAVFSGYPLYPTTVAGLPVDWRVPASIISDQTRWNDSWARWPGKTPDEVLASWHWLGHWLHVRVRDLDVIAPLLLLVSLVPSLLTKDAARSARRRPMLAVVIPSLAALAVWFLVAPDPRFALAPIWLVTIALAAWALPPANSDRRLALLAALSGVLAAGALYLVGVDYPVWLLLVALDLWALAAVATRFLSTLRMSTLVAHAALLSLALVSVALVAERGAFHVVHANQGGTLGTPVNPVPNLVVFTTRSGLELTRPSGGADQCWGVILCVPQPNSAVRRRGSGIAGGFAGTASPR